VGVKITAQGKGVAVEFVAECHAVHLCFVLRLSGSFDTVILPREKGIVYLAAGCCGSVLQNLKIFFRE
jgi:hypothetical protein